MIIDNKNIKLKEILKSWINKSDEVLICSPFISYNDILFELIDKKFKMTLICRLSYPATPELFSKINNLISRNQSVYVYDDSSLHSKIYYFKKEGKGLIAIIGSSNFTESGIYSNKEYNITTTKELDRIDLYFSELKKESYGKLNEKIIEYYKSFYRRPEKEERYKKAKISTKLAENYSETLEKFHLVKGILERENQSNLPFTYVFDSFSHFFKTQMIDEYSIIEPEVFNTEILKKYFKLFLKNYLERDYDWRVEKYKLSKKIFTNLSTVSSKEIRTFFLGIHSIATGSGSGLRKENIRNIDITTLRKLLEFFLESNLKMSHKYSVALTSPDNNGLKVPYIGESSIGEVPGWLIPEEYPIKNGKLHFIFDFFKI